MAKSIAAMVCLVLGLYQIFTDSFSIGLIFIVVAIFIMTVEGSGWRLWGRSSGHSRTTNYDSYDGSDSSDGGSGGGD